MAPANLPGHARAAHHGKVLKRGPELSRKARPMQDRPASTRYHSASANDRRSASGLSHNVQGQGFIVLAILNPSVSNWTFLWRLNRMAERASSGSLCQEAPRMTRNLGSPSWSHADPSTGPPSKLSCHTSSTHSQTLPYMSNSPNAFGRNEPTGAVWRFQAPPQPLQFA